MRMRMTIVVWLHIWLGSSSDKLGSSTPFGRWYSANEGIIQVDSEGDSLENGSFTLEPPHLTNVKWGVTCPPPAMRMRERVLMQLPLNPWKTEKANYSWRMLSEDSECTHYCCQKVFLHSHFLFSTHTFTFTDISERERYHAVQISNNCTDVQKIPYHFIICLF